MGKFAVRHKALVADLCMLVSEVLRGVCTLPSSLCIVRAGFGLDQRPRLPWARKNAAVKADGPANHSR